MSTILCSHMWSASIIYLSFIPLITGKIASVTESFSRLYSMSRDGMSKDTRKMSHMHIILIGVSYNTQIMGLKILANCYVFLFKRKIIISSECPYSF